MTGYEHGNVNHHTHLFEACTQSLEILKFLKNCGYNGMVVSEALLEYQTSEYFEKLVEFYREFEDTS